MAIAVLGFSSRSYLRVRRPIVYCVHKARHRSSVAAVELPCKPVGIPKEEETHFTRSNGRAKGDSKALEWKKLSSKDVGITTSMIASPTRYVLNRLKNKGYEVYLVGGCVRDLILKRTPKDFDIITSVELKEVARAFLRCEVVGKQFPICHVHVNDTVVEVSSFSTTGKRMSKKFDYTPRRCPDCDDHDYIRWSNCWQRDFTINGLMFDPYAEIVYDYMAGMQDIKNAKVRTIIPANMSFAEDCDVVGKDIHGNELHASLWICRSFLEVIVEIWTSGDTSTHSSMEAAYLVSQGFRRGDKRSNMLLSLFSNLDKLVAPDRPCHNSLWVGMLAFHKALADQPRHPLVVAAFCLAVHNDGSLSEAVEITRRISQPHDQSFSELLDSQDLDSDKSLIDEIMDLAASVKSALIKMTDERFVSQAMSKYPQAPYSDLVFISLASFLRASKIFECETRE